MTIARAATTLSHRPGAAAQSRQKVIQKSAVYLFLVVSECTGYVQYSIKRRHIRNPITGLAKIAFQYAGPH
jgi:hypothetical protein